MTFRTKNGDEIALSAKMLTVIIATMGTLLLGLGGTAFYLVSGVSELKTASRYEAQSRERLESTMRENQTQVLTAMATTDAYIAHQTNRAQKMESLMPRWAQEELKEWDLTHPAPIRVKPSFRRNPSNQPQENYYQPQMESKEVANERSGL